MYSVERDGFAIVPRVVTATTISRISHALSESIVRRTRAGVRNVLRIPAVRELATQEDLLELARQVLGPGAIPFRTTLFDKSAPSNWLVVWHQDTALPLRERRDIRGWGPWSVKEGVICAHAPASALEQVLAIRVHLDDSNEENGPLKVLPATHDLGVLNDDQIHALAGQEAALDCCVAAGGVLLMRLCLCMRLQRQDRMRHVGYCTSNTHRRFCVAMDLSWLSTSRPSLNCA